MSSINTNSTAAHESSGVSIGEPTVEPVGEGGDGLPLSLAACGATVEALTRLLALFGGVMLIVAIILTLASVVGRYLLHSPVPGDYELVEIICGIAVFLFFPFTHALGSNLKAEFFTSGISVKRQRVLDVAHDIIFTVIGALLTWRMIYALEEKIVSGETSILIGVPLWWGYAIGVCSVALLTLVCVLRVVAGLRFVRQPIG